MRILMISDVYFPRVNGVSTSIQTFSRALSNLGHEVTLIAPDYGTQAPEPFDVIRIPSRYLPLDPEDRILKSKEIRRLIPALKQRGFDLVHIHTPFVAHYSGLHLAKQLGIPAIETYHTFFEEYLDKYIPLIPRRLLRFAARRFSTSQCNQVDALVVPSQAMLNVLRGYGVKNRAQVIPTGIELAQFSHSNGERFRRQRDIGQNRPVLVHVSRLAYEKNIGFLLEVLARVRADIPDVLMIVAGEGPARKSLEKKGRDLGLDDHLLFIGYLDRNGELEDCYGAGDAFVFASRTETQGLVLLEALALGVPVVSTAVMGTKEVLAGGRGSLTAKEEVGDFARKTVSLLRDPELRQKMRREARDYATEWSAPLLTEKMLDLYQALVPQREKAMQLKPAEERAG